MPLDPLGFACSRQHRVGRNVGGPNRARVIIRSNQTGKDRQRVLALVAS